MGLPTFFFFCSSTTLSVAIVVKKTMDWDAILQNHTYGQFLQGQLKNGLADVKY